MSSSPKLIDITSLDRLRRDRHVEGTQGIWIRVPNSEIRLHVVAATDANPAFVEFWDKMQAELRRLDGVGATKEELQAVRARYYARMFVRGFRNVPGTDGKDAEFSQEAATEMLTYIDDALIELAEKVFEHRNFRFANAERTIADLKDL